MQPEGSEPVKVSAADLEMEGGLDGIDFTFVEPTEDLQKEGGGEAFSQLFLSRFKMRPNCPRGEGLRRPPLRSGLLSPSPLGQFP